MGDLGKSVHIKRFGVFEVDLQSRQIRKAGANVRLQQQPFDVLAVLLERPGELVTRKEFEHRIWAENTHVDFDHSLRTSINKIRAVLGDSAETPRFVETLPRRGYRFVAPVEVIDALPAEAKPSERRWSIPDRRVTALACLLGIIAAIAVWSWFRGSRARWARREALPEIERLIENDKLYDAFWLATRAERYLPGDYHLKRLLNDLSVDCNIQTNPPGVEISIRDYANPSGEWTRLGTSPMAATRIPITYFRFQASKEGFESLDCAFLGAFYPAINLELQPGGSSPDGMVYMKGGYYRAGSGPVVKLEPYWIDRYEVTNRQFQGFVQHGGYNCPEYWKQPVVMEGRTLSWQESRALFLDETGRPGPATWNHGTYPEGDGDLPVNGVSWYEAAAFAEFAGKSLPTIYHWGKAAGMGGDRGQGVLGDILPLSNLAGEGLSPVGAFEGISSYGVYDVAGNVREWCWNEAEGQRYTLGGAWNEPGYLFRGHVWADPLQRSANQGFRCVKYARPPPRLLLAPVSVVELARDCRSEEPVSDEVFEHFRKLYSYDRTPLNARVESVDEHNPYWRVEKVRFDAAYADEHVPAYLYLPRNTAPPYQTLVHFPGGEALEVADCERHMLFVDFIIRSGRAVLYPLYQGHFERRARPLAAARSSASYMARDRIIEQCKDLRRALDYLETRPDIDSDRLAYTGVSVGAWLGPVFTAIEDRFRAAVFLAGGIGPERKEQPEVEPLNFAPRSRVPVLMINGREDTYFKLNEYQVPLFQLLGARNEDKRHAVFDSGHLPPRSGLIKEVLGWLDRYLGPVQTHYGSAGAP